MWKTNCGKVEIGDVFPTRCDARKQSAAQTKESVREERTIGGISPKTSASLTVVVRGMQKTGHRHLKRKRNRRQETERHKQANAVSLTSKPFFQTNTQANEENVRVGEFTERRTAISRRLPPSCSRPIYIIPLTVAFPPHSPRFSAHLLP